MLPSPLRGLIHCPTVKPIVSLEEIILVIYQEDVKIVALARKNIFFMP
jgi:hypothetical protein